MNKELMIGYPDTWIGAFLTRGIELRRPYELYIIVYTSLGSTLIPEIVLEKNAARVHLKYNRTQIKDKCKFFSFRCGLSISNRSAEVWTSVQRRLDEIWNRQWQR